MADLTTTEEGKTLQLVPCCVCGSMILPNEACLCVVCLQRETSMRNSKEDVNELLQCKSCDRWCSHIGKDSWAHHAYESAGLLALCLKKLGAVSKAKILDAAWIWTEPHSRRLKLYVDVEKVVLDGKMNVQQRIVAEFVLKSKMCNDCMRSESDHSWGAMIQLRQRVNHQRSLVVLETQLTKAGMHNLMIGVENSKQGMDFFFKQKNQAEKVVNFISTHLPTKSKFSKRHISTDARTSKHRYELTYAVDIVPLGRGDLVIMPVNLQAKNSSAGELVLVSKVASSIHLLNPLTLKRDELIASKYFAKEKLIRVLMSPAELVRFVILDIEPIDGTVALANGDKTTQQNGGKLAAGGILADAEVARESDLGCNDITYRVRTHLGHLLRPGDLALGYDMVRYAFSDRIEQNGWLQHQSKGRDRSSTINVPDIILVQKDYGEKKKIKKSGNKKDGRRKKNQKQKSNQVDEATEKTTEELHTEVNAASKGVFSFPNNTDTEFSQLSVLDECLSEDEEEAQEQELQEEGEGDEYFDEGMEEVEDYGDLEGLFAHLVDRNVAGPDEEQQKEDNHVAT